MHKPLAQRYRCLAWIAGAVCLSTAHRLAHAESPRLDPCAFDPQAWLDAKLEDAPDRAPRDGLVLDATFDRSRVSLSGPPVVGSVNVKVFDELNMEIPGSLEWGLWGLDSLLTNRRFAWRPAQLLASKAHYSVRVVLQNDRRQGCPTLPPIERNFEITTRDALTPAPPAPPLTRVDYGIAWVASQGCCVPRDTSACSNPALCLKCWSWAREPLVVPVWGEPSTADDVLLYFLYRGAVDHHDVAAYLSSGVGVLPLPQLTAADLGQVSQGEVCLTAMTRNFRTGKEVYATVCASERDPALGNLAGTHLPDGAMFAQPSDPTLELGPAACDAASAPPAHDEDPYVAASYTSDPQTCIPTCGGLFDSTLVVPADAAASTPAPTSPDLRNTGGCAAARSGESASLHALWLPLLVLAGRIGRARRVPTHCR
jgi:hypothetical protein